MEQEDRRRHPRVSRELMACVVYRDRCYILHTRDISAAGVFMATRPRRLKSMEVGETVSVELIDDRELIAFRGRIARLELAPMPELVGRDATGIAVEIEEIDSANRTLLKQLLPGLAPPLQAERAPSAC